MNKCLLFLLAYVAFVSSSCYADGSRDRFTRAEKVFRRSGPMAVVALYIADARKGDATAAFYVATSYAVEAAMQRKKGASFAAIKTLEDSALHWYQLSNKGGNEEAGIMLDQVRKHGRSALYFISIEHLLNREPTPESNPERFYRRIKRPPAQR
jgi:hypothetical protein